MAGGAVSPADHWLAADVHPAKRQRLHASPDSRAQQQPAPAGPSLPNSYAQPAGPATHASSRAAHHSQPQEAGSLPSQPHSLPPAALAQLSAAGSRPALHGSQQQGRPQTMHPSNCYAEQAPDFAALAKACPRLRPHLKSTSRGPPSLDFTDPDAARSASCSARCKSAGTSGTAAQSAALGVRLASRRALSCSCT